MNSSIKSHSDLVTTHQAICAGFLAQAKEKSSKAAPHLKEAKKISALLAKTNSIESVLQILPIEDLASAMGFSEKAQNKFSSKELKDLAEEMLKTVFKGAGKEFREEILYRFLLTRGDTLGGSMRNVTGAMAQRSFTSAIAEALNDKKIKFQVFKGSEDKVKWIQWTNRTLIFDYKPKFIDKNIDVILLKTRVGVSGEIPSLEDPSFYLCCGELKGGIDPAGADEHWKTARTALERIRQKFKKDCPHLFFAANAIEESMAKEIFNMLCAGELAYAVNLNNKKQLTELSHWLITL